MNILGNPLNTMSYTLDCFLIDISNELMNIIYLRILVAMALPIGFITVFFISYGCYNLIAKKKCRTSIIITTIIYMFFYM